MKIAAGTAKGLEYLHDKADPSVIYRDLKSANILLGEGFHPKLSDFGLAKLGPSDGRTHVSTRVMGTYGYCAPEYARTGKLTPKSDIYSFGVVLLEIITGRKAIDPTRTQSEQNLVVWVHTYILLLSHFYYFSVKSTLSYWLTEPDTYLTRFGWLQAKSFSGDKKKAFKMADPRLGGHYPRRAFYQALTVACMCVHEEAASRPLISDVVTALTHLASQTDDTRKRAVLEAMVWGEKGHKENNTRNC